MINDILAGIPCILSFMIGPVFFILLETSIIKGFRAALVFDLELFLILFYRNSLFRSYRLIQSLKDQLHFYFWWCFNCLWYNFPYN
jgi:hypothetical protein